jgi:hypothetical protein
MHSHETVIHTNKRNDHFGKSISGSSSKNPNMFNRNEVEVEVLFVSTPTKQSSIMAL